MDQTIASASQQDILETSTHNPPRLDEDAAQGLLEGIPEIMGNMQDPL